VKLNLVKINLIDTEFKENIKPERIAKQTANFNKSVFTTSVGLIKIELSVLFVVFKY
jgi:hypothetical protein